MIETHEPVLEPRVGGCARRVIAFPDGSWGGWRALTRAAELAAELSATLVIGVVRRTRIPFAPATVAEVEDARRGDAKVGGQIAAHALELAEMYGVAARVVMVRGSGVRAIVATIESERPNVVVLRRTHTPWRRFGRWDRAELIRSRVACDVVIVG